LGGCVGGKNWNNSWSRPRQYLDLVDEVSSCYGIIEVATVFQNNEWFIWTKLAKVNDRLTTLVSQELTPDGLLHFQNTYFPETRSSRASHAWSIFSTRVAELLDDDESFGEKGEYLRFCKSPGGPLAARAAFGSLASDSGQTILELGIESVSCHGRDTGVHPVVDRVLSEQRTIGLEALRKLNDVLWDRSTEEVKQRVCATIADASLKARQSGFPVDHRSAGVCEGR
jgi:hypothetical protein